MNERTNFYLLLSSWEERGFILHQGRMKIFALRKCVHSLSLTHTHKLGFIPLCTHHSFYTEHKLYILSPIHNPTPKSTHHRQLSAFLH